MNNFRNNAISTINYIECPAEIDAEAMKDFAAKIKVWPDLPSKIHALDFKKVKAISNDFYKLVAAFHKPLHEKGLRLVSINVPAPIEQKIKSQNMVAVFGILRDFNAMVGARGPEKTSPEEVRQTLIKYLVAAARRAMETLFEVTVAADENYLENLRKFQTHEFHRASVLSMKSELFSASFHLYFPQDTLVNLTKKMVGEAATDEETTNSTATELLNMIYGGAKSHLNDEKNYNLPPAIPTLVLKDQISQIKRSNDPRQMVIIPLASPLGIYFLEVDFS